MRAKCVILPILYLALAGVYVLGLDSSWTVIVSLVILFYLMLISRKHVLIQDSYEVTQPNVKSSFSGNYYYFGKNLDSWVLVYKAFIKLGVLTAGYAGVGSFFIYFGKYYFTIPFSVVYLYCVARLLKATKSRIRKVNPDFRQALTGKVYIIACSFVAYLFVMTYIFDFRVRVVGTVLLVLVSLACYLLPVVHYYCRINESAEYQVKVYGNVDELFYFRFKTIDGKEWELNKDFIFLVVQDSGDYNLILSDRECKLIKKSEIAIAGYFVRREENYGF